MSDGKPLWAWTIGQAADALRRRELTPLALLEAHLERIDAVEPSIHAFIHLDRDGARRAAEAAGAEIAAGTWKGPLHGIPFAVKDNYDVAGLPATAGSRLRLDNIPDSDAVAVARLKEAGAICVGNSVSLDLTRGETLGLVGETGSGKSTLGRLILRLIDPDSGSILFAGATSRNCPRRRCAASAAGSRWSSRTPYGSLDPRMTVRQLLEEPMIVHGIPRAEIPARLADTMRNVGLSPAVIERYPHEFSGGQRQRIGIARALVLDP
jgi:ABC-type glutathione transport system ATPase component